MNYEIPEAENNINMRAKRAQLVNDHIRIRITRI